MEMGRYRVEHRPASCVGGVEAHLASRRDERRGEQGGGGATFPFEGGAPRVGREYNGSGGDGVGGDPCGDSGGRVGGDPCDPSCTGYGERGKGDQAPCLTRRRATWLTLLVGDEGVEGDAARP